MNANLLLIAATLAAGIGLVHSYLGERYLLIRLFRRNDLTRLFGSDDFTRRTLRFAWHITSLAWWAKADPEDLRQAILQVIAATFRARIASQGCRADRRSNFGTSEINSTASGVLALVQKSVWSEGKGSSCKCHRSTSYLEVCAY